MEESPWVMAREVSVRIRARADFFFSLSLLPIHFRCPFTFASNPLCRVIECLGVDVAGTHRSRTTGRETLSVPTRAAQPGVG